MVPLFIPALVFQCASRTPFFLAADAAKCSHEKNAILGFDFMRTPVPVAVPVTVPVKRRNHYISTKLYSLSDRLSPIFASLKSFP